jgi:hypothetical protein
MLPIVTPGKAPNPLMIDYYSPTYIPFPQTSLVKHVMNIELHMLKSYMYFELLNSTQRMSLLLELGEYLQVVSGVSVSENISVVSVHAR